MGLGAIARGTVTANWCPRNCCLNVPGTVAHVTGAASDQSIRSLSSHSGILPSSRSKGGALSEPATRASWQLLPEPEQKEMFEFAVSFTKAQADKLRRGHVPRVMEERWFVFFEDDWLIFCRSWSGAWIYGLHLAPSHKGMSVDQSWVSRDPEHNPQSDIENDRSALTDVIAYVLEYNDGNDNWW